ncbi:MAG: aminoglycoside phosphotransferase family protein, partial [Pseudomonadota bacterium]
FIKCFKSLSAHYLQGVDWEKPAYLESRAANLLPALLLARIDGKSPVEYLTEKNDKDIVRQVAIHLLRNPINHIEQITDTFKAHLT